MYISMKNTYLHYDLEIVNKITYISNKYLENKKPNRNYNRYDDLKFTQFSTQNQFLAFMLTI